ncbi:UNVERIFIED_CONTAM: putative disease resistance RPP13-like protein 3 [Sesamum angustifolium]|uniref:Disease resistance RPP13-like protein 3 n=1 Tax=Sesamum angustifolium TaxID=2727405 RepID=A0AAW2QAG1_9LAMI
MAEAAVTFLLENLQQLVADQVSLISGAQNELEQLQNELDLMKSFLEDSASKREKGEVFKTLEKQIREIVYSAEDTIDTCVSQAAAGSWVKRNINLNRLSLAKEVQSLREEKVKPAFNEARMKFATLQIADAPTLQDTSDPRKISLLTEKKIVGLDDEADKIIKYLNEDSKELEVISIIGMPGLGKTTLALKIYRDSRIQYEFPTIIWVYVSEEYNKKDIFLTILKKFTQQDMSRKSEEELAQQVKEYLSTGKFLIIMDDVWTPDAWDQIEAALPKSNRYGKILITSRYENVAWRANRDRVPHRLRFLNQDESWELLQLEVFGKEGVCPPELEITGKLIAEQCDGLPLAIVVIGGILVDKLSSVTDTKTEWKKVSDSVQTYISNDDKNKRMENIISLSYNKLPYELRDCFLYLGMFPEDYEIPAWKLIRLWIAEGFVKQKPGKSLEDTAEDILKELVNRNLVMVDKIKPEGEVKTCHVHDMIREFCKHEAALKNQNLFEEIKMSTDGVFESNISEMQKFRRLCIHSYVVDFFRKRPKAPKLRSFWCFSKADITLAPEHIPYIIDTFNLLRVFDVNPIRFKRFPTKITELVHLRYIALSGDDFKVLPKDISNLWNLQTIIINTNSRTFEIKADILKMMQLRHLKTKAAIILTKQGEGKTRVNLQTLTRLSPQCCTEQVFDRAPNLKTLGIRGQLLSLLDNKSLANLGRLQKLKLVNDAFPRVAAENPLQALPQPDRFPPNLRILTLSSTFLDWKHMSILGMLNALEVLKLKENAFMGKCWEVVAGGFNSLEFLYIARTDLQFWTVSGKGDHFPKLRCLVLKNCEKLHEVPTCLVEKLQTLDMERVTKHAVACARKIEQEKQMKYGEQSTRRGGFKLIIAPGDE